MARVCLLPPEVVLQNQLSTITRVRDLRLLITYMPTEQVGRVLTKCFRLPAPQILPSTLSAVTVMQVSTQAPAPPVVSYFLPTRPGLQAEFGLGLLFARDIMHARHAC
jgi:hypothetical protein